MNPSVHGRPVLHLAVILASLAVLGGCKNGSSAPAAIGAAPAANARLAQFNSADEMTNFIKDGLRRATQEASSSPVFLQRDLVMMAEAAGGPVPVAAPTAGATTNMSTTNVQEAGVDEADRIKSDGRHLYLLHHPNYGAAELRILALGRDPLPRADPLARVSLEGDVTPNDLYLLQGGNGVSDRLVTLGSGGAFALGGPMIGIALPRPGMVATLRRDWFVPWSWQQGRTELQMIDISAPGRPEVTRRITLDGHLVESRRIGDVIYLVTRFTPSLPGYQPYPWSREQEAENQRLLAEATVEDLLPHWSEDGEDRGVLVQPTDCFQPPLAEDGRTADLVTVTAIRIDGGALRPVSECVTGSSEAIYVSTESLYLATTRYTYRTAQDTAIDAPIVYEAPEVTTELHKFALSEAGPRYQGSGSVPGHLGWEQDKKSFRMGEHQGVLRIATSLGESWDGSATTRLTLLEEGVAADGYAALVQVSELPNRDHPEPLGLPGEQLYAARFIGDRGYLVTFRVTDPLYVLDLSDPRNPRTTGQLHIEGYSDYLHPVNEHLLLGVGKDAIPDTTAGESPELTRGAWYQGVKVALFDVRNPAAPREINHLVIGKRGTQSAALSEHHAFTYMATPGMADGTLARLALPIDLHETISPYNTWSDPSEPWYYYDWTHTGLYLFDIREMGVTESGRMVVESATTTAQNWLSDSDRALLLGDDVHYVRGGQVWSSPWIDTTRMIGPQ